jgi:hypothetical protein
MTPRQRPQLTTVVIRTAIRRAFSLQARLRSTASVPADEELMQLAQRADGDAFEIVCDRHATVVFSLA